MTRFNVCLYSLIWLCVSVCFGPSRVVAQPNAYTITQFTPNTQAFDHKWPSMNNVGDKVWCQQVGGFWQVFKNGAQLTTDAHDHKYPVISNAPDVVYVEYGIGGGVGRQVIKYPNGTIEFSSFNSFSGAHRDAGEQFGISSDGKIISYYDFDDGFGDVTRRLHVNGAQVGDDFSPNVPWGINSGGTIVYTVSGFFGAPSIYTANSDLSSPTLVASGTEPRIADSVSSKAPEIVYLSGGQVVSTKNGTVDTGLWADVDKSGDVIYEQTVNRVSQIFLAKPSSLAAPTNLTVTAISSTSLKLAWNYGSDPVDGFRIERKTGDVTSTAPYTEIAQAPATLPHEYPDSSLTAGGKFTYRVRAYKGSINSDYSDPAVGTIVISISILSSQMISDHQLQIMTKRDFGNQTAHVSVKMTINQTPISVTEDRDTNTNDAVDQQPVIVDFADYDGNGNSVPRFTSNEKFPMTVQATFDDGTSSKPDSQDAAILLPVVMVPGIFSGDGGDKSFPGVVSLFTSNGYQLRSGFPDPQAHYPTLYTLNYSSTSSSFAQGANALNQLISGKDGVFDRTWADKVNIVGHSKGGLVARKFLQTYGSAAGQVKELVTAESPHLGASIAAINAFVPNLFLDITNLYPVWPNNRFDIEHSFSPRYEEPKQTQQANQELAQLDGMARTGNDDSFPANVHLTLVFNASNSQTYAAIYGSSQKHGTMNLTVIPLLCSGDGIVPAFSQLARMVDLNDPLSNANDPLNTAPLIPALRLVKQAGNLDEVPLDGNRQHPGYLDSISDYLLDHFLSP